MFVVEMANVAISIYVHIYCRNGTVRVCLVEMWPNILYMLFKSVVTFLSGTGVLPYTMD